MEAKTNKYKKKSLKDIFSADLGGIVRGVQTRIQEKNEPPQKFSRFPILSNVSLIFQ